MSTKDISITAFVVYFSTNFPATVPQPPTVIAKLAFFAVF
jgi:hypothetical protein